MRLIPIPEQLGQLWCEVDQYMMDLLVAPDAALDADPAGMADGRRTEIGGAQNQPE